MKYMKNQKIRFGVIGVGRIGKIHTENLVNRIVETEVIAVSDVISTEAAKVAKQFNIPNIYSDYNEILKHRDIDAIAICQKVLPLNACLAGILTSALSIEDCISFVSAVLATSPSG